MAMKEFKRLDERMTSALPQLVREQELAQWLGVTRRTLLNWVDRGILPKPIKFAPAPQSAKCWTVRSINKWIDELEWETKAAA